MDQRSNGQPSRRQTPSQRGDLVAPGSLLARIGMAATISVVFLRAVWYPDAGFYAIEFWLLLFIASASKARNHNCACVATAGRD